MGTVACLVVLGLVLVVDSDATRSPLLLLAVVGVAYAAGALVRTRPRLPRDTR